MTESKKPPRRFFASKRKRQILLMTAVIFLGYLALKPKPPEPVQGSGEPMQAIVYEEYGPPAVLHLRQVERPLPGDEQVLVKIVAAGANPLDWHYLRGTPYLVRLEAGLRKPKDPRLGVDMAGVVVAVGKNVTRFKMNDAVFGTAPGSFAEYALASQHKIVLKPADLSFDKAAAVPVAALTALQGLRDKGRLKRGQKVLINGASGGVGTFAVQIAKALGAEVTGVCSTRNAPMVRALGADHVIDYKREDFTAGMERYDLILDNVGNHSLAAYERVLTPSGIHVTVGGGGPDDDPSLLGPMAALIKGWFRSLYSSRQFVMMLASINDADLTAVRALIESKQVTPVIDRRYPLSETPEAIRYLETGRARGKVIITIGQPGLDRP